MTLDDLKAATDSALDRVDEVFAGYPPPRYTGCNIRSHTACRRDAQTMRRLIKTPPARWTAAACDSVCAGVFTTGLRTWQDFAFFVPGVLRVLRRGDWIRFSSEMFFEKLLIAAHPECPAYAEEYAYMRGALVREPMKPEERAALYSAVEAILEEAMADEESLSEDEDGEVWLCGWPEVRSTVSFMAAFHGPIQPFLERWIASPFWAARLHLCLLMIDWISNDGSGVPFFRNSFLEHPPVLQPENAAALSSLLNPASVASYLTEHEGDLLSYRIEGDAHAWVQDALEWARDFKDFAKSSRTH